MCADADIAAPVQKRADPLLVVIQPVPVVAVAPIIIVVLGTDDAPPKGGVMACTIGDMPMG